MTGPTFALVGPMRNIGLASLLAVMLVSQGCYLGRSGSGKKVAYAVNGALVVGGVAFAATPADTHCLVCIPYSTIAIVPIALGLAGLVLNAAIKSPSQDAPVTPLSSSSTSPTVRLNIGPGLSTKSITLDQ
ncbi:MAG: hypothetical protein JWO36_1658 [Myxococcales bacterium]|nr:hypothetical protein [Myxococcales bacterium]